MKLSTTHAKSLAITAVLILLGGYLLELYARNLLLQYIHPAIQGFVVAAGLLIALAGVLWMWQRPDHLHATWTQIIACAAIGIIAVIVPPRALSVGILSQRQVGDVAPVMSRTTTVRGSTENFTVLDWVAAWEADATQQKYLGAPARVTGFISERDGVTYLTRFLLTCCVVDAQPVQVEVRMADGAVLPAQGTWVSVSGSIEATERSKPRVVGRNLQVIPEPQQPYVY
jgi:putative membrane protein